MAATLSWGGLLAVLVLFLNITNTFAQVEPAICNESPLTITTPDRLEQLVNCTSLPGDLVLSYVDGPNITLDKIETIGGMVQIHLVDRTTLITAANLTSIGGLFMIAGGVEGQSQMKNISMPLLSGANGLDFTSMPKLRKLAFPARINNPLPAIRVTIMNTGLDSIEDLNIDYKQIQQIYFGGNPNLKEIKMGLESITTNLDIGGDGARPAVSFPELGYLNTANIHDIGSLDLPKLQTMGGALGIYDCRELKTLDLPMLKRIGTKTTSVLAIANNTGLSEVLFPELETITGGISTENNLNWLRLDGFPKLSVVTDDMNMKGSFTLVQFPMLYNLTGKFNINSDSGLRYTCADLEKMNTDTSKPFKCDPYGANVFRPADGQEDPNKPKSNDDGLTGPKITGIAIGCLAAVIVPLLFIRWLIVRKRKRNMVREKTHFNHVNFGGRGPSELDSRSARTPGSRAELPPHAMSMSYELPATKKRAEMEGDIPHHELPDTPTSTKKETEVNTFFVPDSPINRMYSSRPQSDISSIDDFHIETAQAYGISNSRGPNVIN